MELQSILPDGWPRPKGYSNGMLVSEPVRWLHIAGQVAWDAEERLVGEGDFARQFEQALGNVVAVIEAAGGEARQLVSMTIYVTDKRLYVAELSGVGSVWRAVVGRHFPALALVEVQGLLEEGALVEIQAVAALEP